MLSTSPLQIATVVSIWPRLANAGNSLNYPTAISTVPTPPMTREPTAPNRAAVAPDSNSPNWLDAPMNIELTADIGQAILNSLFRLRAPSSRKRRAAGWSHDLIKVSRSCLTQAFLDYGRLVTTRDCHNRCSRVAAFGQLKEFSLPRFHKAVVQLATSDPHC